MAKFESEFHKRYVGGEGEVAEQKPLNTAAPWERNKISPTTMEDVLEEYRWYMGDPAAELPEALKQQLLSIGTRTENDGKN